MAISGRLLLELNNLQNLNIKIISRFPINFKRTFNKLKNAFFLKVYNSVNKTTSDKLHLLKNALHKKVIGEIREDNEKNHVWIGTRGEND